jgi:hypothetical protein
LHLGKDELPDEFAALLSPVFCKPLHVRNFTGTELGRDADQPIARSFLSIGSE